MALLVTKNILDIPGIEFSEVYIRLRYTSEYPGDQIQVKTNIFPSKDSYSLGQQNQYNIIGIPRSINFNYDRSINGNDTLLFAHNSLKSYLSTDLTEFQNVIDPSTREPMIDPSTGDLITEEVIIGDKFAMDSSISIVDIEG